MAKIPTYERNPQAQQLGGTTKISVSGSPVAQALGQLGGTIQNIGVQFVQKQQQLQDLGAISDYNVVKTQAYGRAEALWNQTMQSQNNQLTIEEKPKFIKDQIDTTLGRYVQDINASDEQKMRIQNDYQEGFAKLGVSLDKEVQLKVAERNVVKTQNAVNTHIMSAQDAFVSGDTAAYEIEMSRANELLLGLENTGAITPEAADQTLKQGWYSATARMLASSQSTVMVDETINMIESEKQKYTPAQYQEVLRLAETQKRNIKAGAVGAFRKALTDKNATPEQIISVAEDVENEFAGATELAKSFILGEFAQADEEVVAGVRQAIATTPQAAQDAVENYMTWYQKIGFKRGTAEEQQKKLTDTLGVIINAEIPDPRVKQLMIMDVLEQAETVMQVGITTKTGRNPAIEAKNRKTAYDEVKKTYNNLVKATGDQGRYKNMPEDFYNILAQIKDKPDADVKAITTAVLSDTIAEMTRISTQSLLNASMSTKEVAKRIQTIAFRFNSMEEANKANIPVGSVVIVDGVEYIMEAE